MNITDIHVVLFEDFETENFQYDEQNNNYYISGRGTCCRRYILPDDSQLILNFC